MAVEGGIRTIGEDRIAALAADAAAAPRKRSHFLLHDGPHDQVQRLLIVLQPGTYVRPHKHSEQWELLVLQRGGAELLSFSDEGQVLSRTAFGLAGPIAEIAAGTWHGIVVLEPATAVLEVKPGPYRANEFAQWAPDEGNPDAARFEQWARRAKPGTVWQR
jgi:cupin fold WbuC family metalloprotein